MSCHPCCDSVGPFVALRRRSCWAALFCFVLGLWGGSGTQAIAQGPDPDPEGTVYLLRHAEKTDDGTEDPPLSAAGQERAESLVKVLRSAGVTHLHSTDYQRTRQTLAPLAQATGLTVEFYDPRAPAALVARLRKTPGVHVVVGHSNTIPELVRLLGGDPRSAIDESEYDRLYVVRPADGWSALLHWPPWTGS